MPIYNTLYLSYYSGGAAFYVGFQLRDSGVQRFLRWIFQVSPSTDLWLVRLRLLLFKKGILKADIYILES
jgi:hypothetical protein